MTVSRVFERTGITGYWYHTLIVGPKRGCSNSHRRRRTDERKQPQTAISKNTVPGHEQRVKHRKSCLALRPRITTNSGSA